MLAELAPEYKVVAINAAALFVAYVGIYPTFRPITWTKIVAGDFAVSIAALTVAGMLFMATGTPFSLIGVQMNWAVFSILTLFALEIPFVTWFTFTHEIEGDD